VSAALGDLKLWIVCYTEDREPLDRFVTAYTAEEAFAMWRVSQEMAAKDYMPNERSAQVFLVPQVAGKPTTHSWWETGSYVDRVHAGNENGLHFDISHETLTTMAVEAVWKETHCTFTTEVETTDDLSAVCSVVPYDSSAVVQ
jgi:hypothetical protein